MKKIKTFLKERKNRIYIFLSLLIILGGIYKVPYITLYINPLFFLIAGYIIIALFFRIPSKINAFIAGILMLCSIPWILIGSRVHVEALGSLAFFFLVITFIQEAWEMHNTKS